MQITIISNFDPEGDTFQSTFNLQLWLQKVAKQVQVTALAKQLAEEKQNFLVYQIYIRREIDRIQFSCTGKKIEAHTTQAIY